MEESRELSDEELEHVIGGAGRVEFSSWRAIFLNQGGGSRKELLDEQFNKERERTRDD